MNELRTFLEFFIPLFVAIDPFGMLPVFLSVTANLDDGQRRRASLEAIVAASIIAIGFMFLGQAAFDFLGITENDFKIAGGILLLVLAVYDLLIPGKASVEEGQLVGIVPLAMPLIVGPATMTTILVLSRRPGGQAPTALSLALNLLILLGVMLSASRIARLIGHSTLRAVSKLIMLLLAAIGVNFIRSGIMAVARGG